MEPTFIEMFSGIGGVRFGLEPSGWKCVWANDWDKYANIIYKKNFGDKELVENDIKEIEADAIPDHTLLTAGFPCQAFSVAGKRKGFQDTRGTLFFDIARVTSAKRPSLLLLENVKGLLSSQKGYTFCKILQALDELGYDVEWQVLNSKHFGVPQNRERVFIVGHLRGKGGRQIFPIGQATKVANRKKQNRPTVQTEVSSAIHRRYGAGWKAHGQEQVIAKSALIHSRGLETRKDGVSHALKGGLGGSSKNFVSTQIDANYWKGVDRHGQRTMIIVSKIGRGQKYGVHSETCTTLRGMARHNNVPMVVGNIYPSGGEAGQIHFAKGIFSTVKQGKRGGKAGVPPILDGFRIRRLTPTECERLQGFPDGWTEGVSDTQRYKLLGNAVTVNVIEYLGRILLDGCVQQKEA